VRQKIFFLKLLFGLMLFLPSLCFAANMTVNGFGSFFARQSLTDDVHDNSLEATKIDYSNSTRVGINVRSDLNSEWSAIGQLVASQKSLFSSTAPPNWTPAWDWIYLNYVPSNNMTFKFGRQLFPTSMTSEYIDVGLVYPWRKLPVQFILAATPFKWFEGASGAYQFHWDNQTIEFKLFTGGSRPQPDPGSTQVIQIDNLTGGVLSIEKEGLRFQVTLSKYQLGINTPSDPPVRILNLPKDNHISGVGGYYDRNNIVAYAEYAYANCGTACGARAYYGTLGYHIESFLPYVMYSDGAVEAINTYNANIRSTTIGLNYQVDSGIVLKTEYLTQNGDDIGPARAFLGSKSGAAIEDGRADSYSIGLDVVF